MTEGQIHTDTQITDPRDETCTARNSHESSLMHRQRFLGLLVRLFFNKSKQKLNCLLRCQFKVVFHIGANKTMFWFSKHYTV